MKLTQLVIATVLLVSRDQALPIYQTTNSVTCRSGDHASDTVKRSDHEQKGASPKFKVQCVLNVQPSSGHQRAGGTAASINERKHALLAARGLGGKMLDFCLFECMPIKVTEWRVDRAKEQFAKVDAAELSSKGPLGPRSDSWWTKQESSTTLQTKLNNFKMEKRRLDRKNYTAPQVESRHESQVNAGKKVSFTEETRLAEGNGKAWRYRESLKRAFRY